jgi:ATP-dependent HslUV protease subunit HslV
VLQHGNGGGLGIGAARADGHNAALWLQHIAIAMLEHTELSAPEIVKKSLEIAGELCIYTNMNHTIETLD